MTEKFELYHCETCGNIAEIIINGNGDLMCCGEPMKLLTAQTDSELKGEYHLPIKVLKNNTDEYIQVGLKQHPMTEEHHIKFIQIISEDGQTSILHFLETNDEPTMQLYKNNYGDYIAREFCNIHGLWANLISHK